MDLVFARGSALMDGLAPTPHAPYAVNPGSMKYPGGPSWRAPRGSAPPLKPSWRKLMLLRTTRLDSLKTETTPLIRHAILSWSACRSPKGSGEPFETRIQTPRNNGIRGIRTPAGQRTSPAHAQGQGAGRGQGAEAGTPILDVCASPASRAFALLLLLLSLLSLNKNPHTPSSTAIALIKTAKERALIFGKKLHGDLLHFNMDMEGGIQVPGSDEFRHFAAGGSEFRHRPLQCNSYETAIKPETDAR